MRVEELKGRIVFLTNSKPTIEIEAVTRNGVCRASVPMGTSRGKYEVKYVDPRKALRRFEIIKPMFIREDFENQKEVDEKIKEIGGERLEDIGGNLALALSSVFLKCFALENNMEVFEFLREKYNIKNGFPFPVCNVIGGWEESDVQEILLLPFSQESFLESVEKISRVYLELAGILEKEDPMFRHGKNIESAWVSSLPLEKLLQIVCKLAKKYMLFVGMDVAASNLWDGKRYFLPVSEKEFTPLEYLNFIQKLLKKYPIFYVEDPFHEDDFDSFAVLTHDFPDKLIVGDDLYATNLERLKVGCEKRATNALIIKPNQVGTISDVIEAVLYAKKNGLKTVFSHRSGESDDVLICHLAVGLGADYVKFGISGERVVKLNEMIRIEEKLSS